MNTTNNSKIGDSIILLEEINNNLSYINKELPKLDLPDDMENTVQKAIDRFMSKTFDLRNMFSVICASQGVILMDPLLEEIEDVSPAEAIQKFLVIMNEENEKLCEVTDHINELENEDYPDIQGMQVLLSESSGNILLLGLKIKACLLESIFLTTNTN